MRIVRWISYGVGGWLAWRIFGPELAPRFELPQNNPLPVPGRTVIVGSNEMFVREVGPDLAPVLVLVHGWNLDGAMTFHRITLELAERYRVIIPDLRNHGRSDWVRGRVEITDLADDVAGILMLSEYRKRPCSGIRWVGWLSRSWQDGTLVMLER